MIAQLPMYLRPENKAAHEALWALIRDGLRERGLDAPDKLDTKEHYEDVWGRDDLVLSQVCNLPLRGSHKDKLTLIGACDYELQDCLPGHYRSLFVVRRDNPAESPFDLDGATLAYNDRNSHSGFAAPLIWAQKRGMRFLADLECGAHVKSAMAVINGDADLACIDAQTWRDLTLCKTEMRELKVIGATEATPGQTFCTRAGEDAGLYFSAISEAIAALPYKHRLLLGLRSIVALDKSAYHLPMPPQYKAFEAA